MADRKSTLTEPPHKEREIGSLSLICKWKGGECVCVGETNGAKIYNIVEGFVLVCVLLHETVRAQPTPLGWGWLLVLFLLFTERQKLLLYFVRRLKRVKVGKEGGCHLNEVQLPSLMMNG